MTGGAVATKHTLHDSLDEMLSHESMGRLEGRTVATVTCHPWVPEQGSASGCPFLRVTTSGGGGGQRRYVVKRTGYDRDLIMRDTEDRGCREMLVWQHGLLDRLPPEIDHPILGAAEDEDGWAILMRDVGADVFRPHVDWPSPGWQPLTLDDTHVLLDAMAAFHAQYWEDTALLDPALGLCPLPALYASFSPAVAEREAERVGSRDGPHLTNRFVGWSLLEGSVTPDVARLVRGLHADGRPLCDALGRYPWTFVHGDLKRQNVGLAGGTQRWMVLLDWQFATRAPPAVDLTWFLSMFAGVLPICLDEAIEAYRGLLEQRLGERFDDRWWQPQLELAILGDFVRHGHHWMKPATYETRPDIREHYRALLGWWTARMRAGAALL